MKSGKKSVRWSKIPIYKLPSKNHIKNFFFYFFTFTFFTAFQCINTLLLLLYLAETRLFDCFFWLLKMERIESILQLKNE